jgi:hypothetical protein
MARLIARLEYSRASLEAKRKIGWVVVRNPPINDDHAQDDPCLAAPASLAVS